MTGIDKSFGGVQALTGAQLEVAAGEVHALLGENGAGKSTLVKVIAGAHQRDAGAIHWEGEEIEIANLADSMRLGIRVIHQHLNVIGHLSVEDNLTLGREKTRFGIFIDRQDSRRQAAAALARIGVRLELGSEARGLRVAERQLIEIGRALQGNVKLLVMDEPTASLGDFEVEQLFKVVRGLRSQGVAVVYISHKLDEVLALADRITVMRDGQYISTVRAEGATAAALVEMMVGRKLGHVINKHTNVTEDELLRVQDLWTETGLKGVSFTLHRGEVLGVYGLMGSGRTELARALFGADRIESGEVRISGKPVSFKSPAEAKRHGVGLVPEDRGQAVFPLSSVRDNLSIASPDLIARHGFVLQRTERSLSQRMIDALRVRTPSMEEPIGRLSGGNQQKAIVGRWLMRQVPILILDDPTSGVDVGAKEELYRLIGEMTGGGTSIIMSSSELPELLAVSDRMLILHQGRVAGILSGEAMTQRNVLHLAMRGVDAGAGDGSYGPTPK
jgi:ribose transport system ATP-binding protein